MNEASLKPRHRWFAAFYDRMAKLDEKREREVRRFVAGGATGRVVEIGCGTGLNFEHYDWSRVESVAATEPDIYMLRRAEAKAASLVTEARQKLGLREAPAEHLPFEDDSFDCAVVTLVLCTVSDPERSLAELRRVLSPGGQLRLFEHVAAEGFTGRVQKTLQPVYGWMAAGCQLRRDTEASVRAAGFELEVTERRSLGPLWPAFVGVATRTASP